MKSLFLKQQTKKEQLIPKKGPLHDRKRWAIATWHGLREPLGYMGVCRCTETNGKPHNDPKPII